MDAPSEEKAEGTTEEVKLAEEKSPDGVPAVTAQVSGASGEAGGPEESLQNGDLSSINAMMSTVMSAAGTINADGGSGVTSASASTAPSPSPSPSKSLTTATAMRAPPSRNARRTQDSKEDSSAFTCPLCDKACQTQHQLTMHIRQHNTDAGANDHSCSICGKCLSSASSLDRHMLVHSGERPYKCSVCGQTFTTNGNMHRHMKIHEKDPASGLLPISPPSPTKRRRPSIKRRQEEDYEELPTKKQAMEDAATGEEVAALGLHGAEEELLPCPICFKICNSRLELDAHMDTHPDTALRCDLCCLSFRTHRGLLRHNAGVHKLLPQDPNGRPFIQNNPSIPTGFNDLAFIDFSCKKFPHIAQVWCETNLRRCISKFHRFVCDGCDKAFPLSSALDIHKSSSHPDKTSSSSEEEEEEEEEEEGSVENQEGASDLVPEQASFLEGLGLQHVSKVKAGPTDDEIHQAHLDSIKMIHVEPPSTSLPQELASAYLSGGLGLALGLSLGSLTTLSIPLIEGSGSSSTLQGLSQRDALNMLSLQPFQAGFLLQPNGGAATGSVASSGAQPSEAGGAGVVELADIQQILKVASAAPTQMGLTLPPLAKTQGFAGAQGQKTMPLLKPKPPISPRSSLTATTPPPLQSSQQASLGCISPSLPPPTPSLFKSPSSSSSTAGNDGQLDAECAGDAQTPPSDSPPAATMAAVHEEAGLSGRKPGAKVGNAGGGAKGSFPCRFCDQVFAFSGVLQAHMRYHLGILPHQCNICDYVAPDKATLIRHLRTHSGERPYVCRVCHYPFTVKANCERHLRKKHAKTSRKDIEKNIKYVTSTSTANMAAVITAAPTTPQDTETGCTGADTTCRYCGEDLKTYRALQIHLRTHNGCQRKPFECRRCGAAFLAKRNCIHHLLKQHPEVQEREIEEHIATLLPATAPVANVPPARSAAASQVMLNGTGPPPVPVLQAVKVEELPNALYPTELDQPLDFSAKARGSHSQSGSPGVKLESVSPSFDSSDQPIDLSIPSKRQKRETTGTRAFREIKMEQISGTEQQQQQGVAVSKEDKAAALVPNPQPTAQHGCYQLPHGSTTPPGSLTNLNIPARAQRLKPLLPKPASASTSSAALKELPPLASIAQIIHSVSGAPDLLKREATLDGKGPAGSSPQVDCAADGPGLSAGLEIQSDDTSDRKRSRKKPAALTIKEKSVGLDLESSGEFASVEKMLATTDANKFSPYLQTSAAELGGTRDSDKMPGREEKEGGAKDEMKAGTVVAPQSKGKKNAYSNSVQKMTCPYCPRVFPWASSLQRHMLTHTGQKPFPCPKCDALFSTKSNCERHLLRKHGVTQRTLRRNGAINKTTDDGSHESAESQSETEQMMADPSASSESGSAPIADDLLDQLEAGPTPPSPAHKPGHGCGAAEPPAAETTEQTKPQGEAESGTAEGKRPPAGDGAKVESADDDDCQSNKSLDLNFGKKLIDFKLSSSSGPAHEEPPAASCPTSAPPPDGQEMEAAPPSSPPAPKQQPDSKHVCQVCQKSFRYATTLTRHQRAHVSEPVAAAAAAGDDDLTAANEEAADSGSAEEKEEQREAELEEEEEEGATRRGDSEGGDSGESEEEEKEKEERSDEEASEPKSAEGEEPAGRRVDKRKKICSVCGKRFWSLQDLTRHMRSHTGERPYKCQTCERTFTLKHSLVRHQRIHLKPRWGDGALAGNDDVASEDGDSCTPTPPSTCPPSENESECGSGLAGAKELEEDVKEEPVGSEEERCGAAGAPEATPTAAPDSGNADLAGSSSAPQEDADTETPGQSEASKEPPPPSADPEGFIQGLLEIRAEPPLERVLPGAEPPLVGVE